MKRKITILGSTGSIGTNTVDLIERDNKNYEVVGLSANRNFELLAKQAKQLNAKNVVIVDESKTKELKEELFGTDINVLAGKDGLVELADMDSDWTMSSIVGSAGLKPTLKAIDRGKTVALANKETLVCAGDIVMKRVKEKNATLVPVDSEHSAIFQVFDFEQKEKIDKIILTASGGPFRTKSIEFMEKATPKEAIAHPNWSMGAKISVDSASMMNKGLELIEAYHLFGLGQEKIDILVHPESIIHSGVTYIDGSFLAQMGTPDMRTPIAYALGYPKRITAPSKKLDLAELAKLTFYKPDYEKFKSLSLAKRALKEGGSSCAVFNGANEMAVSLFLDEKIGFLDIAKIVEKTMDKISPKGLNSLDDVFAVDEMSRQLAKSFI